MSISVEELAVDGAPQVGVTVSTSEASVVSVEMSWDGSMWHPIATSPRSQQVVVDGTVFFRHFTPPLNVATSYRLVIHSGDPEDAGEDSIMVESDTAWLQDPLDPRTAVPVYSRGRHGDGRLSLVSTALQTVQRPQGVDAVMVSGASIPVASVSTRQAPSGVPLSLFAFAAAQSDLVRALQGLFAQAGAVVARGLPAEVGLDPVVYVVAPDLRESPTVGHRGMQWRRWDMTLMQVRGPGLRVVIPWFTYEQVVAAWEDAIEDPTYEDVIAARPGDSYIDWQRSPEP